MGRRAGIIVGAGLGLGGLALVAVKALAKDGEVPPDNGTTPGAEVSVLSATVPEQVVGSKGSHPEAMLEATLLVDPVEGAVGYVANWYVEGGTAAAQIGIVPHATTQPDDALLLLPDASEYSISDDIYFGSYYLYHPDRKGVKPVYMEVVRYKALGEPDYETVVWPKQKIGEILIT